MPKGTFISGKDKKEVEVPDGANLRKEALKAGVQVYAGMHRYLNCRGLGLCGTCRVLVKQGAENLSPKTRRERFKMALSLFSIGHENEMRRACQATVNGDCSVVTQPALNLSGETFWQKPYPNK